MIIHLSEIMSAPHKTEHMEVPLELTKFMIGGSEYQFASKKPVSIDFSVPEERKVCIDVKTELSLTVPCARCLDDVIVPFTIALTKELDFQTSDADGVKDLEEVNYIDGYDLDVDLLVFDEISLNFPLQVLCQPDCKGLCGVCGKNKNRESCDCDCSVSAGDPRMSVIQDIFKNYKEV